MQSICSHTTGPLEFSTRPRSTVFVSPHNQLLLLAGLIALVMGEPGWSAPEFDLSEGTQQFVSGGTAPAPLALHTGGSLWLLDPETGVARPLSDGRYRSQWPALSPDGSRIAYERVIGSRRHLRLIGLGDGSNRQIVFGESDDRAPAWHPDGKRLAFVSDRGGDYGIWELKLDSLALTQLTFRQTMERDPAYSPDGRQLAFVASDGKGDALWLRQDDGSLTRLFGVAGTLRGPAWRPDGQVISYVLRSGGRSRLELAILDDPVVRKPLSVGEYLQPYPAVWADNETLVYSTAGGLRRRGLNDFESRIMPVTLASQSP